MHVCGVKIRLSPPLSNCQRGTTTSRSHDTTAQRCIESKRPHEGNSRVASAACPKIKRTTPKKKRRKKTCDDTNSSVSGRGRRARVGQRHGKDTQLAESVLSSPIFIHHAKVVVIHLVHKSHDMRPSRCTGGRTRAAAAAVAERSNAEVVAAYQ